MAMWVACDWETIRDYTIGLITGWLQEEICMSVQSMQNVQCCHCFNIIYSSRETNEWFQLIRSLTLSLSIEVCSYHATLKGSWQCPMCSLYKQWVNWPSPVHPLQIQKSYCEHAVKTLQRVDIRSERGKARIWRQWHNVWDEEMKEVAKKVVG